MERWAVKQIKGLAYNDLVASKTDRQTVKKLFKGESMRAVTLLNTLLNQILRESEHFLYCPQSFSGGGLYSRVNGLLLLLVLLLLL